MVRWSALLMVLSLLAFPAISFGAEAKDKCNGAEGVAPALIAECNQAIYDRCRPGYTQRCIDGMIKDFRVKTKEQGATAQRAAETASEAVCNTDEFVAACEKAKEMVKGVCQARGTVGAERSPEALAKWRDLFARAPEVKAYWAGFAAKYPKCQLSRFRCNYSDFDRDNCLKVEDTFREMWSQYQKVLADEVARAREDVARLAKNPFDWGAAAVFDELGGRLLEAQKFAGVAFLGVNASELGAWSRWLADQKGTWQANREGALATIKCPAATNNDKALTARLRKVLDQHDKATRKPDSKMTEAVGSFGLTGSAVQSSEIIPPVTHEDQGGFACVRQEQAGKNTCRILKVTFRRDKPAGGKWGAWGFYSVGGGDEMSCKNLK
jgi:hypothetical protein